MPLPDQANITIGGTSLKTDPGLYQIRPAKRWSEHRVQGGEVMQDFGTYIKDAKVRLGSGPTPPRTFPQLIDAETAGVLNAMHAATGATFAVVDWLGANYTVAIIELNLDYFTADLFTYDLLLKVRGPGLVAGL